MKTAQCISASSSLHSPFHLHTHRQMQVLLTMRACMRPRRGAVVGVALSAAAARWHLDIRHGEGQDPVPAAHRGTAKHWTVEARP